jgi:hypothetical protein
MKNIVFMRDTILVFQSFADDVDVDFEHIALTEVPLDPIESWYIKDGKIKIDQLKLAQFKRQNMPTLTPIEFDIKLVDAGLYDQVQELIQSDVKLKIAYTRATFFSRTDAFIDQARVALGLTDEQVDEMWV